MRFRVRYCGKCDRFILIEDNKKRILASKPQKTRGNFQDQDRLWRNYHDIEGARQDDYKMQNDMACPYCGDPMPDAGNTCQVPLMLIEGRFE